MRPVQKVGLKIILTIAVVSLITTGLSCSKLVVKVTPEPDGSVWPMYGGDAQRTNRASNSIKPPLELTWIFKASSAVGQTLVAADGVLYFGTLDGRIRGLDVRTGKELGKIKIPDGTESTCALDDGRLVVGQRYGEETLAVYDLHTGKRLWRRDAGDIASEILIVEDNLCMSAIYNHVDRYDLSAGTKIWSFTTGGRLHSSPAYADGKVVVGCDDGWVYALNWEKGTLAWKYQTHGSIFATPTLAAGKVFIGSTDKQFYALRLQDGTRVWTYSTDGAINQAAAVSDSVIIFGANDHRLYCLLQETGKLKWSFEASSVVSTSPLISGEVVYFGSLDHFYYALDLTAGQLLWKYQAKGRVRTCPVVWKNFLFGASEDNFVYAFKMVTH